MAQSSARPPHSLLEKFRSDRRRLPLHPREKAVLAAVAIHLCYLPWALGTMTRETQLVSLALAVVGFVLALWPRHYTADQSGGVAMRLTMWPRLVKFPIFWIGLALLLYIVIQGLNPSWIWTRNATSWWLVRAHDIPWLPTSVQTPYERFNLWRQLGIYASAWLTVCTVWTGFTRRRSLQLLLVILAVNAIGLALVGFLQGMTRTKTFLGLYTFPDDVTPFASFFYKNHAGAYLALTTVMTAALATWNFDQGERSMKKSTPAGLWALAALFLAGTVLFTLSRGATITLCLCTVAFFVWFFVRRKINQTRSTNPAVTTAVVVLFLAVLAGTFRYVDFSAVNRGFNIILKQRTEEVSLKGRLLAYDAGGAMLKDHWVRGVGSGSFRFLFPGYIQRHPEVYNNGHLFWEHVHRDWLELPIELGVGGIFLILAGGAWWISFFVRRHALWHSLAIPVLLGCSQTLIHAWFDFPFQNPAVLITWMALIALSARWIELEADTSGP